MEDLTEVTIFRSYCIVQLKTVSLRKKCILSRKTAYLKGKKMQEGPVLKFILLKETLRFLKEVHEGTAKFAKILSYILFKFSKVGIHSNLLKTIMRTWNVEFLKRKHLCQTTKHRLSENCLFWRTLTFYEGMLHIYKESSILQGMPLHKRVRWEHRILSMRIASTTVE